MHRSVIRREVTGKSNYHKVLLAQLVHNAIHANPDPKFTNIKQSIKNNLRRWYNANLTDEEVRKIVWYMQEKAIRKSPNKWKILPWNSIIRNLIWNYPVFRKYKK
jgi:hypothetical protein